MTCTHRTTVPVSPSISSPNRRRTGRLRRLAAAAIALLTATGAASAAPVQWPVAEGGNGHYYEYVVLPVSQQFTWEQARDGAAARTFQGAAGHLATITSDAERLFVLNRSGATPQTRAYVAWLGGVQADGATAFDTGWTWITGEPWQYTAWAPGEPNDNAVVGTGETGRVQRLTMHFDPAAVPERYGLWNDESAPPFPQPNAYVVEFSVVPEPTTALPLLGAAAVLLRRRSR